MLVAVAMLVSCVTADVQQCRAAGHTTWRHAYVVDAGLATLRSQPGLHSRLLKRLRHGRMVAIVERARIVDGIAWIRVAVTRRTRGWLPVEAVASPGDSGGECRLAWRLGVTRGLARLELARLAIDRFPRLRKIAAREFAYEAERVALMLTDRAAGRFDEETLLPPVDLRMQMLLDPLLDRYVRLGVRFDADPATLQYRVLPNGE